MRRNPLSFRRPRGLCGLSCLGLALMGLFGSWASPAQAACPTGAPSCTVQYDTAELDWALDLNVFSDLCAEIPGAQYQAFEEEPQDGTIGALVYHPVDGRGELLEGPWPLALLVPGNGHQYLYYEDLLSHLAAQGMVAVSLGADPTSTAAQRAEVLLCGARFLHHAWSRSTFDRRLAFVGHSRGGEGAVMAANRLKELQLAGSELDEAYEIEAVVAIAPAANCDGAVSACLSDSTPDYIEAHANLADEASPSLFVIQGSRDGDVPGDGLRIYEDASSEGPGFLPDDMTKAMIWAYEVPHGSWGGESNGNPDGKGRVLGRAYVGAFLRWWLLGEAHLRRYFAGEATPPCIADPGACGLAFPAPEVFPQYREGAAYNGDRRRIHDFEWPQPLDPSYLGPVNGSPVGSAHVEDLLTYTAPFANHVSTEAVAVPLGPERESGLRFLTGNYTDFSAYSYLSLRLAKPVLKEPGDTEEDCAHVAPGDLTVGVSLKDWTEAEHEVLSSDYQRVTDTDITWGPPGFGADPTCHGKTNLTTVRIPLLDFWQGGVNPQGVLEVALRFGRSPDDGYAHEVLVDSLELTINDIDPHCGNGVVEGNEVCDTFPPEGESCLDYGFIGGSLGCSSACLPDTSACIAAVCGNGMLEGDEECDDGNLSPYDDCNPDCTVCPPGEPLCRCLGTEAGEEDPNLPYDGVLGDGTYCNDDVLYEGMNRCVEMVGGNRACIPCSMDSGPFCPCDPWNDSCFASYDPGFDADVVQPNAPGDAFMTCSFGLKDPEAPGGLDPALTVGYCFAEGETEAQGGAPPWFFDWYCETWHEQATYEFDPGLGHLCLLP